MVGWDGGEENLAAECILYMFVVRGNICHAALVRAVQNAYFFMNEKRCQEKR